MKYIICGIDLASGTRENDSSDLTKYFELGWEVVGSRIDMIARKNTGNLDQKNTTIVTFEDRMFMYQNIFDNVISTDTFRKLHLNSEFSGKVENLPSNYNSFNFLNAKNHVDSSNDNRYYRYEEDFKDIFFGYKLNEKYNKENLNEKIIIAGFRSRSHGGHKNSSIDNYEEKIIKILASEFLIKSKNIFIVGNGKEVIDFCLKNNFTHIKKLADFVTILKNPNCICHIAPSTGTTVLSLHAAECPIIQIDPYCAAEINGINAILGGKPSHFFTNKAIFLKGHNMVKKFISKEIFEVIKNKNFFNI